MNFRTWFKKKLDSTVNNYEFSVMISEFHNKVYEKILKLHQTIMNLPVMVSEFHNKVYEKIMNFVE